MLGIAGSERSLGDDELVVSKTDLRGHIVYVNDVFLGIADFAQGDVLGKPHSVVRNPAMPRAIFRIMWARLAAGREVFAYIVNRTKFGDHYWVLAHVTPSFGSRGEIVGYHSTRRKPDMRAVTKVKALYADLLAEEGRHGNRKEGLAAASAYLDDFLRTKGLDYDEYVLSL